MAGVFYKAGANASRSLPHLAQLASEAASPITTQCVNRAKDTSSQENPLPPHPTAGTHAQAHLGRVRELLSLEMDPKTFYNHARREACKISHAKISQLRGIRDLLSRDHHQFSVPSLGLVSSLADKRSSLESTLQHDGTDALDHPSSSAPSTSTVSDISHPNRLLQWDATSPDPAPSSTSVAHSQSSFRKSKAAMKDMSTSYYERTFREFKRIGKGGFGSVFHTKHKEDGRKYAVKKVKTRRNSKAFREVEALAAVPSHPNIIRYVHSWSESVMTEDDSESDEFETESETESETEGETEGESRRCSRFGSRRSTLEETIFIQMELVEGGGLKEWMSKHRNPESEKVRKLFTQIVEGVSHIHANGYAHRDLKPDNILVSHGKVKIVDFGLSKKVQDGTPVPPGTSAGSSESSPSLSITAPSSPSCSDSVSSFDLDKLRDQNDTLSVGSSSSEVGTCLYTPPEFAAASVADCRKNDMYALGIVLFELLHPFDTGMERAHVLSRVREGKLPQSFVLEHSELAPIVSSLLDISSPSHPTSKELLAKLRSLKLPTSDATKDNAVTEEE